MDNIKLVGGRRAREGSKKLNQRQKKEGINTNDNDEWVKAEVKAGKTEMMR